MGGGKTAQKGFYHMARYREHKGWTIDSVRKVCKDNELFTRGNIEEYDFLLNCIRRFKPTLENIQIKEFRILTEVL